MDVTSPHERQPIKRGIGMQDQSQSVLANRPIIPLIRQLQKCCGPRSAPAVNSRSLWTHMTASPPQSPSAQASKGFGHLACRSPARSVTVTRTKRPGVNSPTLSSGSWNRPDCLSSSTVMATWVTSTTLVCWHANSINGAQPMSRWRIAASPRRTRCWRSPPSARRSRRILLPSARSEGCIGRRLYSCDPDRGTDWR
ncbi:hypothetical protein AB7M49_004203 [Bradyrhizobium elkanii]